MLYIQQCNLTPRVHGSAWPSGYGADSLLLAGVKAVWVWTLRYLRSGFDATFRTQLFVTHCLPDVTQGRVASWGVNRPWSLVSNISLTRVAIFAYLAKFQYSFTTNEY